MTTGTKHDGMAKYHLGFNVSCSHISAVITDGSGPTVARQGYYVRKYATIGWQDALRADVAELRSAMPTGNPFEVRIMRFVNGACGPKDRRTIVAVA